LNILWLLLKATRKGKGRKKFRWWRESEGWKNETSSQSCVSCDDEEKPFSLTSRRIHFWISATLNCGDGFFWDCEKEVREVFVCDAVRNGYYGNPSGWLIFDGETVDGWRCFRARA
jgi:hypothetical protein